MSTIRHRPLRERARGFGLVEILVGVTIGLLALLIVYQVLSLSEGYKRTTTAGGDAQSAGMISSFIVAGDVANGGFAMSEAGQQLEACPNTGSFATTWRPIPVLINDGGADDLSDSFAVIAGVNRRLVTPLAIVNSPAVNPGDQVRVQSPLGFHGSHTSDAAHMFVIVDTASGVCEMSTIGNWGGPTDALRRRTPTFDTATGIVTITPNPALVNTYAQATTWIINLGSGDRMRKVNYDVAANVLRSTDLVAAAAVPNPIVSNVALMKAQYGLDTNGDTFIDTWVSARSAPWRRDDVLAAPLAQLRQIKAIRIALVMRSSQFERLKDAEGRDAVGSSALAGDFTTTLFNCFSVGAPTCTGEITGVTIPASANYRHRVFEQVIPLTNQVWNG
ncbi:MAG TPA: PilW family protein [Casimicrobiaceae bacterium]|nr:PilW family protein [Casimicrobiaceae bacterium]